MAHASPHPVLPNPEAIAARKAEVARVMRLVEGKKLALASALKSGQVDERDAARRNAGMPGILGQLWSEFIALPAEQRIRALADEQFNGMNWQSLLQCSPFFIERGTP